MKIIGAKYGLGFGDEYAWALIAVLVSLFVTLFFSFQAGVFLLLFAVLGWWVWLSPELGFLAFLAIAPILPMLKITQTIGTITLVKDVIIITLFLRLVVYPLLTKSLPYRRNILFAPIVLLAAWTFVEMIRANSLILGILRARDIGLYALLYFVVLYLPHNFKNQLRRYWLQILILIILLVLAAFQWFVLPDSTVLRFDPAREVWIPRISSIMAHPSIFGEYLVTLGLLFVSVMLFAKNLWLRVGSAILFGLSAVAIFLTYSRGVWLGLATGLAVMGLVYLIYLSKGRVRKSNVWKISSILVASALLILVALFQFTPAGVFLRSAVDPTYGSNVERLEFLARLVAPMTDFEALLGRGLGDVLEQNFRQVDLETYDIAIGASRSVQLTKNRTLVDNQHLKTWVEMGLAGLLIYIWIYWRIFREGFKNVLRGGAAISKIVSLWGIGFLSAFVIQGFFIDIWDVFPTNALFWIVAALVSIYSLPRAIEEK